MNITLQWDSSVSNAPSGFKTAVQAAAASRSIDQACEESASGQHGPVEQGDARCRGERSQHGVPVPETNAGPETNRISCPMATV